MAVAAVANRYAIFAGGIGCPGNDCARVEVFDVVLDKWFTPKRNLTMPRQYLMGAGGKDLAVFVGGINNTHQSTTATDFLALSNLIT